jgi:transglutaminase-like putative cysteine protease
MTGRNAKRYAFSSTLAAVVLAPALCLPAGAQQKPPYEQRDTVDYVLRADRLFDITQRRETTINSEAVVQQMGTAAFSVNEHFYDFEVVAAANNKADGRRLDVDRSKILVQAAPAAREALYFYADIKVHTAIFPEVAVGDRLEYVVRYRQKRPYVEGGNNIAYVFDPATRRAGVTVTLLADKGVQLGIDSDGLSHDVEESGDTVKHIWRMGAQPYLPAEAGSVARWTPRLLVTTFPSWDAVGRSFASGANPKAAVTGNIRAKADEITAGKGDRREQARAIFDWVASNVRYVSLVLGNGGFVPHDAASVLVNRYGDCKDHTTLMKALLAAKGIEAQYALINQSSIYEPFAQPMMHFDHVVLYLPEFGLYGDPTASTSAFGILPAGLAHKPVLRVTTEGAQFTRTPALTAERNRYAQRAEIVLAADGTASGKSVTSATGPGAASIRSLGQQISREADEGRLARDLVRQNWTGSGGYIVRGIYGHDESATLEAEFTLQGTQDADGRGFAVPTGPRAFERAFVRLLRGLRENRKRDFLCQPHSYAEEVTITLPPDRKLKNLPKDVSAGHDFATYTAKYALDGDKLSVRRLYVWNRPGAVCNPADAVAVQRLLRVAAADVNARISVIDPEAAAEEDFGAAGPAAGDDR